MTTEIFISLSHITCHECSAVYALNSKFVARAHESSTVSWWCPHCHTSTIFGTDKFKTLQKENEALKSDRARYRDRLEQQRALTRSVEHQRDGMKGALKKQSNRIKNGVCPCCSRSFLNLQRHMKTQHPEYSK